MEKDIQAMIERLTLGGVVLEEAALRAYIDAPDVLGKVARGAEVPAGYKRCGRCEYVKKFYLFNKNGGSKTNTSGSCKECQKQSAKASYEKTKKKRNYKRYYQENKERKQAHARKYYQENKERLKEKHKEYLRTKRGQKVMQKAHAKRRKALAENAGIPYTRQLVIQRDGEFRKQAFPICYLCGKPIEDISGAGLHIDHVIPVVEGGLDCFTNVASTHSTCNLTREKDARELQAAQVESVKALAEAFIEAHPEHFE